MGNRIYRPHFARYSAAAARVRMSKEMQAKADEEMMIVHMTKALYNSGVKGELLSFADYKTTGTSKPLQVSLDMQRDSIKLITDSSGLKGIRLVVDCIEEIQLSVFYFAKEIIDGKTNSQYLSLDKVRSPQPFTIKVQQGQSQEIVIAPSLDLSKFTEAECKFLDNKTFPIVVFVKGRNESVIYYYKIVGENAVKVRESYSVGKETYEVFDLYGMDTEECAVCMGEKAVMLSLPCRHMGLCGKCYENLMETDQKCPICRATMKAGYKIQG